MNEFETELMGLVEDFKGVQEGERALQMKVTVANGKLQDFLKKHNLPEQFSMPELMQLSIRRSRA